MKQQLTFNEMEQIGRKCRRQQPDLAAEISQLSFKEINRIEKEARQARSEAIANMFTSLFKAIGAGITAIASTFKSSGQGNKPMGASAR